MREAVTACRCDTGGFSFRQTHCSFKEPKLRRCARPARGTPVSDWSLCALRLLILQPGNCVFPHLWRCALDSARLVFGIKSNHAFDIERKDSDPDRNVTKTHTDIYTSITKQIIAAIEAGAGSFQMPWHTDGVDTLRPINVTTGKPYRGVNVLALWSAAQAHGYNSDRWATYKQWSEIGAQVRKGEKSSPVVFWKINEGRESEESSDSAEDDGTRRSVLARGYAVFNAEQVDGYEVPPTPPRPEIDRVQEAEAFFAALGAEIKHGGHRAYYRPSSDHIQMPNFESFRDAVSYYSVLAHEVTHWTGATTRLDRDLSGRFGNASLCRRRTDCRTGSGVFER